MTDLTEIAEMIGTARKLAADNAYDIVDDGLFEAFHEIDTILSAALAKLETVIEPAAFRPAA